MTGISGLVYYGCAVLICSIATLLIVHRQYEDGLFGRLFLVIIAVSEFVIVMDYWSAGPYTVLPTTLAVQIGFAGFVARHAYRFARWWLSGDYEWRVIRK